MLDWHSCQICYPLEIKILIFGLLFSILVCLLRFRRIRFRIVDILTCLLKCVLGRFLKLGKIAF